MTDKTFSAVLAPGFPIAVQLRGDEALSDASGRAAAIHQLADERQDVPKPLTRGWFGCGGDAPTQYSLFPFLYGCALTATLWWIWMALGQPFHPAWIVAPLMVITIADWLEHLIQLAQLRHYVSSNEQYVQGLWIQLSGCATIIKLWLTSGLYVSLAGFILKMLFTFSGRRLAGNAAQ